MPAPCALPSYLPALPARPGPGRAHPSPAPAPHPVASHRVRPPCRGLRWPSSNRDSLACSSVVPAQVYAPPINILPPFLPHAPYWGLLWPLRTTLTNQPKLPRPAEPCRPEQPRGARSRGSPQPSRATQLILQAGDLRLEIGGGLGGIISGGEGSGPWTVRAKRGKDLKKERKAREAVTTAPLLCARLCMQHPAPKSVNAPRTR